MSNIQPLSFSRHGNKRWLRFSDYRFAAQSTIIPLMLSEVRSAAAAFPIGFVHVDKTLVPVALLGLEDGDNVFVDDAGQWRANYIPAALRSWPFSIGMSEKNEKLVCVDEDSGLLHDHKAEQQGERFFNDDGSIAEPIQQVIQFLGHYTQEREPSIAACSALLAADLLEPWDVVVRSTLREWSLDGMLRVKESALEQLAGAPLDTLHKAGALALAYAQLQSALQLAPLARLAEQRLQARGEE